MFDRIFRNMMHNITLMPKEFNRGEMAALERFFLNNAKRETSNRSLIKMIREFILIHDDSSTHPLGIPLFIIVIVSFIYEDGFEIKIFSLPNVPIKVNYEFFEITLRQFEDVYGKYLLNESNLHLLKENDFHKQSQCSTMTISTDQMKFLLTLPREELEIDPLVTGEDF